MLFKLVIVEILIFSPERVLVVPGLMIESTVNLKSWSVNGRLLWN